MQLCQFAGKKKSFWNHAPFFFIEILALITDMNKMTRKEQKPVFGGWQLMN